jgi:hypothetical protein
VVGIGAGYLLFRVLDHRAVAIVMAVTTLIFDDIWLVGGSQAKSSAVISCRGWRDRGGGRDSLPSTAETPKTP